ncbi:MAG: bifunctional aspartate kinase/homoserine dehydrogenase I [Gemmatimonadales bacterium]|nr:bifunctional aspartate kinase/homoserine dehydrogenase I [Gemmatimonadales bacterium]
MTRLEVHKFGGTSVGDARRISGCAAILAEVAPRARVVAVASAMAGVTDRLVASATAAAHGERDAALAIVAEILELHEVALRALAAEAPDATLAFFRATCAEIAELARAASLLRDLSLRTRDQIIAAGEKMSVRLLVLALRACGVPAQAMDADLFLETDQRFGEANALPEIARHTIAGALLPVLERGEIPVVTGFCGRAPDGATTTLGRGGSDLTATLVAAALHADEVTIWTDVDGVFSADPRIVPEASVIRQLNFREAAEMSYYGAKVLHQRTMIPVAALGIPVRTRNSFAPDRAGTVVDGTFTPGSHPVKAVTAVREHCLVSIEGKGMAGVPGVAARVFGALASRKISVTMISQSSSECSICLAVPAEQATETETALKLELRGDLSLGSVDEIAVRRGVGLVAVVGLGMAHTPGVAARVFSALGARGINVLAIAQGSSELNISLAVTDARTPDAIRALHAEFGLDRLDTGEDTTRRLDLLLLGCGKIGRALAGLVLQRSGHFFERFGLSPRIVAVADRSGYLFRPNGITPAELDAIWRKKESGIPLASSDGATASSDPVEMVADAMRYRLARPVLVDVSDSDGTHDAYLEAFRLGCDVVTANKKPLAGSLATFRALRAAAEAAGRLLRAEATVGAGLPVVDTLEMLLGTGDRLIRAEGCLSGTLGFVMARLEEGMPFSRAVAEAMELGYTEPDPIADLSGADVARKAVILGRISGLALASQSVNAESLVDPSLAGLRKDEFLKQLASYDAPMRLRVDAARNDAHVLRYMARIAADHIEVGLVSVALDSPAGRLHGTDNLIVFTSERYDVRPLVVMGPGAGVEVTAMGVVGDILRIAAERR